MSNLDAVFLDAGGVLLLPRPDLAAAAFERAGARVEPDPSRMDRGHYAGVMTWAGLREADWPAYLRTYARESGVPDELIEAAATELGVEFRSPEMWRRAIEGAREAVAALCELATVVIVSNSDGSVASLLASTGVCQEGAGSGISVTRVIDSHVVGVAKPDRGIFEMALETAGTTPDRVVHVGDTLRADVEGARGAGIRPLHVDPFGFCEARDHDHVRSVSDVVAVVRGG